MIQPHSQLSRRSTTISLTEKTATELATRVAKQSSGVKVKFGRTNGQAVLHLVRKHPEVGDDGSIRGSETIKSVSDWDQHRWNRYNQPKQPKEAAA